MAEHPATRTVASLEQIIEEIEYLVAHPRIQQKRWVANGSRWLPILRNAHADLEDEVKHYTILLEAHQAILDSLTRAGLVIHQRDRNTWAYSLLGAEPVGAYSSQAKAIEAALKERLSVTGG